MKTVNFEVVEIWYNNTYRPFTLDPISEKSIKEYAIKIGDDFFQIGKKGYGLHICDYPAHSIRSEK